MGPQSFTEEDKKKLVEFVNYVAANATFTHNTQGVISYFHLLSHMQKSIVPKVEAHILEVKRIVETQPVEPEKKESKKGKGA
jgi:hypothetical protein